MDRILQVARALRAASPDRLVDVLRRFLHEQYAASAVELRLVDHGMRSLQPVGPIDSGTAPVAIDDSPQGRAFGSEEPYAVARDDGSRVLHLPVGVRGDRVGVLSVALPAASGPDTVRAELERVCAVVGGEVVLAGRETDRYEVQRRAERLTLAAEMQWLLLPARSCARPEFSLGAHLEPAYSVFGDGFDWSVSPEHLTVVVTNGMGQGVDAAMLTSLMVSAVRNARRAGLGLADQAALADEAVFAYYRGAVYVAVLFLRFDLATGEVEALDAGSPRMWRLREGTVGPLPLDGQLPLGMFGDTPYQAERLRMAPGDRLLIASDGVYDVASPAGESYGERALARTVKATRLLPASQVPAAVLRELLRHHGGPALGDDAVVVCVDWHGR